MNDGIELGNVDGINAGTFDGTYDGFIVGDVDGEIDGFTVMVGINVDGLYVGSNVSATEDVVKRESFLGVKVKSESFVVVPSSLMLSSLDPSLFPIPLFVPLFSRVLNPNPNPTNTMNVVEMVASIITFRRKLLLELFDELLTSLIPFFFREGECERDAGVESMGTAASTALSSSSSSMLVSIVALIPISSINIA